ncbi:hypothetical protein KGF56_004894 [Candida oxycetoniae]|uniref:Uncharacterized protein n=1 Tax=Candida oxycetoniae TaxID=497107 RepID=A0AAI9SSA8_9ASCO|nr:uncharacterized protein KGF56_004894 [Candida oxycetoniae]KAI3402324.2 hypothetical protein KGF56_004894 [Candida oxycetoniae]
MSETQSSHTRSSIHQYLLRIENLEPLVSAASQLLKETDTNQRRLAKICHDIDVDFKFPTDVSVSNPQSALSHVSKETGVAALTYLIEQKYGYKPGTDLSSCTQTVESEIEELKRQNTFLRDLMKSKASKNIQLHQIIEDYESAIFTEILPELRKRLQSEKVNDEVNELLEEKLSRESEVYQAFSHKKEMSRGELNK